MRVSPCDAMRTAFSVRTGRFCAVNCLLTQDGYDLSCSGPRVAYILSGGLALPVAALGHTLAAREEAPRDVG